MVLIKHAKEIYPATAPKRASAFCAEEIAALEAEAAAMSDEELEASMKGGTQDNE